MTGTVTKMNTWSHQLTVIGLKFRFKRQGREMIQRMLDKHEIKGMQLEREPDNPADPNAIKVLLPFRILEGAHLGYLRREAAEVLAPRLDDGSLKVVSATLYELDERDDYNSGQMVVRFRDIRAKRKRSLTSAYQ